MHRAMKMKYAFLRSAALAFSAAMLGTGCQSAPRSTSEFRVPGKITCINLPEAVAFFDVRGLGYQWETRLERGPYISEYEDDAGTYYRGPPGGLLSARTDRMDKPPGITTHMTHDGGFWVPKDPNQPLSFYTYRSVSEALAVVPPQGADCSSSVYIKDPKSGKVDLVELAGQTAAGGAVGAIAGRAFIAPGSRASYGQTVRVGAVGGAIGGLIVGSIINSEIGKIVLWSPSSDAVPLAKLTELSTLAVPLIAAPPLDTTP